MKGFSHGALQHEEELEDRREKSKCYEVYVQTQKPDICLLGVLVGKEHGGTMSKHYNQVSEADECLQPYHMLSSSKEMHVS